jgi:predicted DNA-binding protein (UPF0251 family)
MVPDGNRFVPAGRPTGPLQEIDLKVEELEALRLKDLQGLQQEDCASNMNVSRTTFSRVLGSARRKVADALLNGKAIRIDGGNFEMAVRRFRCLNNHEWDVPFETLIHQPPRFCPTCNTKHIMPIVASGSGLTRRHRGRRRGR